MKEINFDESLRIVASQVTEPTVIRGIVSHWPCSKWTPSYLAENMGEQEADVRFCLHEESSEKGVIKWEADCLHQRMTVREFHRWTLRDGGGEEEEENSLKSEEEEEDGEDERKGCSSNKQGENSNNNKFTPADDRDDSNSASFDPPTGRSTASSFSMLPPPSEMWGYFDYIHFRNLFNGDEVLARKWGSELLWKQVGVDEEDLAQGTLWIGTKGAHTQCHRDTYGYNVIAQIYGEKQWILFPPTAEDALYPTRIPYEESSVYSSVNISNPDDAKHPRFAKVNPFISSSSSSAEAEKGQVVILNRGDLLILPRGWWHDVSCLSTAISVSRWCIHPEDDRERCKEAIVRFALSTIMTYPKTENVEEEGGGEGKVLQEEDVGEGVGNGGDPEEKGGELKKEEEEEEEGEEDEDDDFWWLNPTEQVCSMEENLSLLSTALQKFERKKRGNLEEKQSAVATTAAASADSVLANKDEDFSPMSISRADLANAFCRSDVVELVLQHLLREKRSSMI